MSSPVITLLPGTSPEVLGQDAETTLALIGAERRAQDAAAAREMMQVAHWADLHRADLPVGMAGWSRETGEPVALPATGYSEELGGPLLGTEDVVQLAGEGTYAITEFAVCEVATTLGMSETAARAYVGQTLELRDRLPRCWAKVMAGALPAWKGRRIAAETIPLNPAAAAYVDAHLAPFAHRLGLRAILRAVTAATLRHDPDLAAERAAAAAEHRGVWVLDQLDGMSTVNAVTDTPAAAALDAVLDQVASALGALGDTDPHQVRRAKGLGILADPQYALELTSAPVAAPDTATASSPWPGSTLQSPTIHVHLHTAAIHGTCAGSPTATITGADPVAEVTGYGPLVLAGVQQWLKDLSPGSLVKVTPVVDLNAVLATDVHQPTRALQAQVAERDSCCQFPWCGRQGRYDLDHIAPFVPPDEGGPPGQTSSHNLARLCRFHHRVKTHGGWRYHRQPDGALTWTSPFGRAYTVERTGTLAAS